MWEQYRKSFVYSQTFMAVIAAVLTFYVKAGWRTTLAAFIIMEISSLVGAWWGSRLEKKMFQHSDAFPFDNPS